MIKKQPS